MRFVNVNDKDDGDVGICINSWLFTVNETWIFTQYHHISIPQSKAFAKSVQIHHILQLNLHLTLSSFYKVTSTTQQYTTQTNTKCLKPSPSPASSEPPTAKTQSPSSPQTLTSHPSTPSDPKAAVSPSSTPALPSPSTTWMPRHPVKTNSRDVRPTEPSFVYQTTRLAVWCPCTVRLVLTTALFCLGRL